MADAPAGLRGLSTAVGTASAQGTGLLPSSLCLFPCYSSPRHHPRQWGPRPSQNMSLPSFPPDEAEGHQHRELSGTLPTGSSPFLPVSRSTDTQGTCRGHPGPNHGALPVKDGTVSEPLPHGRLQAHVFYTGDSW